MIRKVFVGCNTGDGFCTFFDFFMNPHGVKTYILKGGPGNGKSSFLRYIGEEMSTRGYDIELQYCSFDCDSLDALVIPAKRVAVVAATGHHVMDPKYLGVVEEILNLGSYLDVEKIMSFREKIIAVNDKVESIFKQVCRYLKAARLVEENMEEITAQDQDFAQVNLATAEIITRIFGKKEIAAHLGRERHLFASSITPEGYRSFIDTLIQGSNTYMIVGRIGSGKTEVLKRVGAEAKARGFNAEYYHRPLDPNKIEHLIIPELKIALTTANQDCNRNCQGSYNYNLNSYLRNNVNCLREEHKVTELVNEAVALLKDAKMLHLGLEKYYVPNMNFAGVDACKARLLQMILNREDSLTTLAASAGAACQKPGK